MAETAQLKLSDFSAKDRNLIRGALRRAFARSDLHKQIEAQYRVEHSDERNPRCKNWSFCGFCGCVVPKWKCAVDHRLPLVPLDQMLEDLTVSELVGRMWCDPSNLWNLCQFCHDFKTALENEVRDKHKIARGVKKPAKRKSKSAINLERLKAAHPVTAEALLISHNALLR